MKLILPVVIFLVLSLPVLADIEVQVNKPFYNLGDLIETSYVVSTDIDFFGLTELSLVCDEFELKYYTLPTSLFAGQSQTVNVPGLGVVASMQGTCYVEADVSSFDNAVQYSILSDFFNITETLPVTVTLGQETLKPAEAIVVSGTVGKSHSSRSSVELTFLGEIYTSPAINNSFAYNIRLPSDIQAGKHLLDFVVNDSYENSGATSVTFTVEAIPTILSIDLNRTVKPGDVMEVYVTLLDQAGDMMDNSVQLLISDNNEDTLFSDSSITPANFKFELPKALAPGTYTATAISSGLTTKALFVVEVVEELSVSFDDRTLSIVNTGNVDYTKELLISLTGVENSLTLSEELELVPGQATTIDLYKEAPEDDYEISLPEILDAPSFEAHLEDERSNIRKAGDFVGITGRVVQSTGTPGIQTILSPVILVVVIGLLIFFFSRNRGKKMATYDNTQGYDEEVAALREYTEDKHEEQKEEAISETVLSRDDEAVKAFMENLNKDKPMK